MMPERQADTFHGQMCGSTCEALTRLTDAVTALTRTQEGHGDRITRIEAEQEASRVTLTRVLDHGERIASLSSHVESVAGQIAELATSMRWVLMMLATLVVGFGTIIVALMRR